MLCWCFLSQLLKCVKKRERQRECPGCTCEHTHANVFACHGTVIFLIKLIERDKAKTDRGRKKRGEANLCFMIWLRSAANTHTTLSLSHTQKRIHRQLTVVTTCQGERQAANLKSLDVCRTGNNLLRSHTHKHTHRSTSHTHTELRAVCG